MKKKRGEILVENVIFIVITLIFLSILVLFISRQGSGDNYLEQSYAKQIALAIDSAKPGMSIFLDMHKASKKDWFSENFDKSVRVVGNVVIVKLSEKGGQSYSFFNDVTPSVEVYPKGGVSILIRE
jgi:hypothetical protein